MSNINKQELREAAERAESDSWGYDRDEFNEALTPSTVLALLDELETADALNKHLELAIRKAEGCSEKLRKKAEAAEERVAELEAREVKLPQRYSMLHRTDFDEPYQAEMVYKQHQVLEALHDAGIRINGED
ncbi:ead/Ea22-like family protein [Enterobacter hormaechei]|uniref:ead/Ea22-like family protein n=1 Tax=Enterobacter cloacae complex TaxID=354276 RepID=UPI0007F88BFD|nr:ead/Ea22-like family protein [Enterobacter hormaechei]MBT1901960.1 ead/Ea22-like family protein [Enterobacter hormaechei subsp. xiangfangensis]MCV2340009.1 ead/Ea22-like family protein [Enterobacter hormaechei]MDQ2119318.1 ead/Ea22-like family protein [Enterobacter hormaechei]MEB5631812.1 ead/Ea22-like family protein [Enterobacter hormaechei]RTP55602.1 ead/Ea22-like family protein [Enterobacter hormaechei]